jgi:hypothetical protein
MEVARECLAANGCIHIDDVSLHESYDLRCELGGDDLHVEVKGTTSDGDRVLLTRNEVSHARDWYPRVALIVVSCIELIKYGRWRASGRRRPRPAHPSLGAA